MHIFYYNNYHGISPFYYLPTLNLKKKKKKKKIKKKKKTEKERERERIFLHWTLIIIQAIYVVLSISFQTFFVQAFKIVIDSWKFTMLLLYILWDDWPIFMISASNEQLQQQLEYTLLKPDCHGCWISKMTSDTLEEWYAIKFCFKLGKNATETYGKLQTAFWPPCMNRASVFEWHNRFKEGTKSVMMRSIGGVKTSIHQSC